MLKLFSWEPIRSQDERGNLAATGYRWTDRAENVYEIFGTATILGFLISLAVMTDRLARGAEKVFVAVVTLGCLLICVFLGRTKCWLEFRKDGLVRYSGLGALDAFFPQRLCRIGDVASIQAEKIGENLGVVLITRQGWTHVLSRNMHEHEARFVSVQLTIAMQEMRDQLSAMPFACNAQRAAID
jgi:hypothetical protein